MALNAWPTRLTIVSWDRFSERDPVTGNYRRFRKSTRIRNSDMHVNPPLVRAQGKVFDDYGVLTLRCADVVEKRPADSGRRNDGVTLLAISRPNTPRRDQGSFSGGADRVMSMVLSMS